MRRSTVVLVAAVFLLPLMTACEGPKGPEGPGRRRWCNRAHRDPGAAGPGWASWAGRQ